MWGRRGGSRGQLSPVRYGRGSCHSAFQAPEASVFCSVLSWVGKVGWLSEVTASFNASFRWPVAPIRGPGACEAQRCALRAR